MEEGNAFEEEQVLEREMATYRFILTDSDQGQALVLQYYPEIDQVTLYDLYQQVPT